MDYNESGYSIVERDKKGKKHWKVVVTEGKSSVCLDGDLVIDPSMFKEGTKIIILEPVTDA